MAATYQIKITNHTGMRYNYIIKSPNTPSPVPLNTTMIFPAMHSCTLAPLATSTFTTGIPSDSQHAHMFLIKATPVSNEEYMLPLDSDILIDFWRDEGGLKGDYCAVNMVQGANTGEEGVAGKIAWGFGFSWRAWTLAPKMEVKGTGPGGAMRYEDK